MDPGVIVAPWIIPAMGWSGVRLREQPPTPALGHRCGKEHRLVAVELSGHLYLDLKLYFAWRCAQGLKTYR